MRVKRTTGAMVVLAALGLAALMLKARPRPARDMSKVLVERVAEREPHQATPPPTRQPPADANPLPEAEANTLDRGPPPLFRAAPLPKAAPAGIDLSYVATTAVIEAPARVRSPSKQDCDFRLGNHQCAAVTEHDRDGDGFASDVDCDDTLAQVHPGAAEIRCNNLDEDCDGVDLCPPDRDHDGFYATEDCDDKNAAINPDAVEIPCNGIDEDCSGSDVCDADGDGDPAPHDCDDHSASRHYGAKEIVCDGVDQDCDGKDCCNEDEDGDGYPCRVDCDDRDPATYPGAAIPDGCYIKDINCDGKLDGRHCHG